MSDKNSVHPPGEYRPLFLIYGLILLLFLTAGVRAQAAQKKSTKLAIDDTIALARKESSDGHTAAATQTYGAAITLLQQTDGQTRIAHVMAWFDRALCLERLRQYRAASSDMKEVFVLEPMTRWPCYAACRIFAEAGNYQDAVTYADKFTVSTKNRAGAYAIRCACNAMLHRRTQAIQDLVQAQKLNFGPLDRQPGKQQFCSDLTLKILSDKLVSSLRTHPKDAETHFELGVVNMLAQQYKDADKHFTQSLTIGPNDWQALNAEACCCVGLHDLSRALKNINRALRIEPKNAVNYAVLERYYASTANFDGIFDDLNQRLKASPSNVTICIAQADAYARVRDSAKELDAFSRAQALDPKCLAAVRGMARIYQETFQINKAITEFTKAISLAPENEESYRDRATCYFALKEYSKALADLTRALETAPDPYTYAARAECYEKLGKADLAEKDKALAKQNGNGS
jgi:tetratricopeptide (TPR) repeat protein